VMLFRETLRYLKYFNLFKFSVVVHIIYETHTHTHTHRERERETLWSVNETPQNAFFFILYLVPFLKKNSPPT
jgi:hypothetical protein